jgi:hypothetical protein
MTILSFELSTDFTSTLIGQGAHTGKIIGTEIITNVRPNNETQFCVTWKINNTTFMDKFKLWAHKETTKNYAHQKLDTLCKAAGIQSPYKKDVNRVNFDASVLVGKTVKLSIGEFETPRGERLPYIKSYETVSAQIPTDEMIINQELPFNE